MKHFLPKKGKKGWLMDFKSVAMLSFLLVILCLSQTLHAQVLEKKINFPAGTTTGLKIIAAIKEQTTTVRFTYDEDASTKLAGPVKLTLTQPTIRQILELFKTSFGINYQNNGDYITLNLPKSPNASAGGAPGTLRGRIVEFETSQPLPGASVYIVELQKGMQSNTDGYYNFSSIPAGRYTLQVSYVSFTTEKLQIDVTSGKEETYNVKLRSDNNLKEVVVSGTRKSRAPVAHTSERQLLGEIKAAQSVVSGISSEQISKSADRNAAEAVRKIAGVTVRDDKFIVIRGMNERYNLTYLNNNIAPSTELYSRAFSLDLIPTRIIDRILVYKSPAPDLLGDMTGGAVKIFTKDARNVKHFDIELQSGYRENTTFNKNFLTYQGGKFDFLGFDDGTRKLPSTVPALGNFNKAQISQATYASSFSNILIYGKETVAPPIQLTANYYNSFKLGDKSLSTLTSFSFKNEPLHEDINRTQGNVTYANQQADAASPTELSKLSTESQNTQTAQLSLLQNFTYRLRDSSSLYFKNFLLNQGQSTTILRDARTAQQHQNGEWVDDKTVSEDLRDIILSWSQRFLYSGNLGGSNYWGDNGKQHLEWNGGYTHSRLDVPDQRAIHLQRLNPFAARQDGVTKSGDAGQDYIPVYRDQGSTTSYDALEQGMISRVWIQNTEQVYNASADYTYKLKSWVTLKAGTYQQWKQREVYRRAYTVNEGDLNSSGYPDPYNPRIGGNGQPIDYTTVFFHQQDLDKVWSSQYLRDDGSGLKVFDRTNGSDDYIATEQNNSGYLAASLLPFNGKLDIYGGLRVEYNRQKVAGALPAGGLIGDVNTPVLADVKATSYLPSLNIGYRPNNSLVFRGAYGKTVNRPEFRELAPYSEMDYINNQTIAGNPNLVSASADNYDLRAEWYPQGNATGETISLGVFEKQIQHPIERVLYNQLTNAQSTEGVATAPAAISFQNANRAIIRGAEIDIRKSLGFIPGNFFRNMSVIANGSWIYSKVDSVGLIQVGTKKTSRQLQGQAPYVVNAGLYYDNAGSGTKVALIFNQVGPNIYAASVGQKAYDDVTQNRRYAGDQGSLLELTRRQLDFSLSQRIVKSLQAKLSVQNVLNNAIQMAEDANFTYKYEKATFAPYAPGSKDIVFGDLLASSYKPGRFFLLTLTYGF